MAKIVSKIFSIDCHDGHLNWLDDLQDRKESQMYGQWSTWLSVMQV